MTEEIARSELRYGLGLYLKDSLGEAWHVDLEEGSVGMQEAVLAIGAEIGGLPEIPIYDMVKQKVEKNRQRMKENEDAERDDGEAEAQDEDLDE